MAVQVDYPGIYLDEFAPGAPITGVSTSVAAFIGVARKGPILKPTMVQSWDAYVATFGDLITDPPQGFLSPAAYGFFLNGGSSLYVVRAATGAMSTVGLDARIAGPAQPVLVASAINEGKAGDNISLVVANSSRLGDMLTAAGSPSPTLSVVSATSGVTVVNPARTEVTLASNTGFAVGDRVLFTQGASTASAIIKTLQGANIITLISPIPGAVNFVGGTARIDDLRPGQRVIRVTVPGGVPLSQALQAGAAVSITLGVNTENATVESSGGDTITLVSSLGGGPYSTANPALLPQVASLEFNLTITDASTGVSELFHNVAMNPKHPGFWSNSVTSSLVTLALPPAPPAPAPTDPRPKAATYNLGGGKDDDRAAAWADVIANPNKYLNTLKPFPDVSLVSVPGAVDVGVQAAVIGHCETMYDRFAILDGVRDNAVDFAGLKTQYGSVRSEKGFAALYYPWIQVRHPISGLNEYWPPSGHMAGIYARTDQSRGVHKAPANTVIRGALALERRLTDKEQGPLNLLGIDILRVFPEQTTPMVWGARTTATDSNWQYVNIRRLFLYVEGSIEQGIRWAIFEPNNQALWQKLKRTINEFLTRVWKDGALFGETADKAFYCRIDEALNPASTQAIGRLYIEIGMRPAYPAEFIILRIGIWQGGSEVNEN